MDNENWFTRLIAHSNICEAFRVQFSSLTSDIKEKKILDLIQLFGCVNKQSVSRLLSADVKVCYSATLTHLEDIKKIFLDNGMEGRSFSELACGVSHLYTSVSAYSGETIEDCVAHDLKLYLFSSEFPLQEAKALGCYSFEWIRNLVDDYDEKLQEATFKLFSYRMKQITLDSQLLLFKHAGIKGYGKSLSLGRLFYLWAANHGQNGCYSYIKNSFVLVRLLHNHPTSEVSSTAKTALLFKNFVVQNTIDVLFHHEKSLLLPPKWIEEEIKELFLNSETARQHALYYIDYLHTQLSQKKFVFVKAFTILKRLNLDQKSKLYDFLHTLLHYFHYLHLFDPNIQARPLLLESIYRLSYGERKLFDQRPQEKYYQEPFIMYTADRKYFTQFVETKWLGLMFLRQTALQGRETSPYLNLKQHVKVIQEVQEILSDVAYPEIFACLLFFQTMEMDIQEVILKFKALKQQLESENQVAAFGEEIFLIWGNLHKNFIAKIHNLPWEDSPKQFTFFENSERLSFLLQLSTYPKLLFSIRNFFENVSLDFQIEKLKDLPYLSFFFKFLSTITIEQGLIVLKLFIDEKAEIYSLFHAHLYDIYLLKQLALETDEKKEFLHQAIFSMTLQERQIFDQPIEENFKIVSLNMDFDFLQFVKKHKIAPPAYGKVILRTIRSLALKDEPSPFLNLKEHMQLIDCIESFLGFQLPIQVIEDLLYFQTARFDCFKIVKKFSELRARIQKDYLFFIAIPDSVFDECAELSAEVMENGISNVSSYFSLSGTNHERSNYFFANVIGYLAFSLLFATYPRQRVSFRNLISFEPCVQESNFSFYPLSENHLGPSWMARWMFDKEKRQYTLVVMMTHFLHTQPPCVFSLPLKLPVDKKNDYLEFLFSIVDRLGIEELSEKEMAKLEVAKKNIERISSETLSIPDPPQSRLEALLKCSPFVHEEWSRYFEKLDDCDSLSLFTFIETLRTRFLASFYWIMNSCDKSLIENMNIETPFVFSGVGIYLSRNPSEIWIKRSDVMQEFQLIYRELVKKKAQLISLASMQNNPVLTTSYLIGFDLKLHGKSFQGSFKWRSLFECIKDQGKSDFICKLETIKITVGSLVSRMQYAPFSTEKEFIDSMCWHIALLFS